MLSWAEVSFEGRARGDLRVIINRALATLDVALHAEPGL
jgi:hypothetical protein